ncbi:MAG TPA: ribosome assembly RNA-binding protein YhbY, partial [Burkholderiaceae bacterium]|nr:ribosome assembly RNA-binding protein YhbY [Burkholderiaceae bacterium]
MPETLDDPGRDAAPPLSSAERRALRARAHDLDPVVMIGDAGLSDGVVAETERALAAHGLIKVRVFGDDREAREAIGARLVERLGCALVQSIGKLLVLWRPVDEPDSPRTPPKRRRAPVVPKKLAAVGKTAPARRPRPAPARAEPPPRRAPIARASGPGMRSARGALDPSAVARAGARSASPAGGRGASST